MTPETTSRGGNERDGAQSLRLRPFAEFLRGRREHLGPHVVGLPSRRVRQRSQGLRREDVADLAGISVTWYTRLEQGRDVHPSPAVLGRIADALRLDAGERAHLFRLARASDPGGPGSAASRLQAADLVPSAEAPDGTPPVLRRLLDGILAPALLMDRYWDVVGRNACLEALVGGLGPVRTRPDVPPRNVVRHVLATRGADGGTAEWAALARACVSGLRATLGEVWAERPNDSRAAALVDLLARASPEFRAWWPEQHVWAADHPLRCAYEHPTFGRVAVEISLLEVRSAPGLTLVTQVPSDGASASKLRQLALARRTAASDGPA